MRADKHMNAFESSKLQRVGREHRRNPDRYFHVMTEGWYIFTREGIHGPFLDKTRAHNFLTQHLDISKGESEDPSASWRL